MPKLRHVFPLACALLPIFGGAAEPTSRPVQEARAPLNLANATALALGSLSYWEDALIDRMRKKNAA